MFWWLARSSSGIPMSKGGDPPCWGAPRWWLMSTGATSSRVWVRLVSWSVSKSFSYCSWRTSFFIAILLFWASSSSTLAWRRTRFPSFFRCFALGARGVSFCVLWLPSLPMLERDAWSKESVRMVETSLTKLKRVGISVVPTDGAKCWCTKSVRTLVQQKVLSLWPSLDCSGH